MNVTWIAFKGEHTSPKVRDHQDGRDPSAEKDHL